MGMDYYASFAPVNQTREELLEPLLNVLFELNVNLDLDFDRLAFENGKFVYTMEDASFVRLEDALPATQHWDGVEFHFAYLQRACSLLMWNDIPHHTTIVFRESGKLFDRQCDEPEERNRLARILLLIMERLRAAFVILEPGCIFKSRRKEDIQRWLSEFVEGPKWDWNLVIARQDCIPASEVPDAIKRRAYFELYGTRSVWLVSFMGEIAGVS